MSEATVDTRVVEARFDSKQFEKGVDRTVKKLDELKSSLNLKDSGKSVTDLTSKISEGTEKASNSLEKLQNRFTSFTGMLKQKLLSGIADEIVGVFFKIKNSFESMVKSMSTAQVSVGMQRYTDILTSVRTLVSAGVNQSTAYDAIERLGTYADQTSYSLDSMVATMSKFKTAGADINTAARMIEGLSNAAASMGVNAQEAERAYLNLQQAYSKKVMLQNDWMSFESIPMVGTKFNQAIIDAAVRMGTLEADKIDKATGEILSYKTKRKAGTKIRSARGITAENMGSNLQSRWFTDEVMEEVFGNTYYFENVGIEQINEIKAEEEEIKKRLKKDIAEGKLEEKDYDQKFNDDLQAYLNEKSKINIETRRQEIEERIKINEEERAADKISKEEYEKTAKELKKQLENVEHDNTLTVFAYQAFRAGQEARSFTDVINTLKDAISRGWAKSFELIFGKLDEAAEFFTKLTEGNLASAIYRIGEFRNAILENWRDRGGRDSMLGIIEKIDDLLGSIFTKLGLLDEEQSAFDQEEYDRLMQEDPTGYAAEQYKRSTEKQVVAIDKLSSVAENLGNRFFILTRNLEDYIEKIKAYMTAIDVTSGKSRLDKIGEVIQTIGNIFRKAADILGSAVRGVIKVLGKFWPVVEAAWANINKILSPIDNLLNPDLKGGASSPYTIIEDIFNNIASVVGKLVGENGEEGPLIKILNVLGDIAAFFVDIAAGTVVSNIQFFSDAFGLLLEILFGTSSQKEGGHGVLDGITQGIQDLGNACGDALKAVGDFFGSLLADLRELLGLNDENGNFKGFTLFENVGKFFEENEFVQKVKTWVDQALIDIGDFIKDIPNRIAQFGISIGDFVHRLFYTEETKYNGSMLETREVETPLKKIIDQVVLNIKTFIESIPERIKNIPTVIGAFIHGLFYREETKYNGSMLETKEVETPLKKWLDQAILDVKSFIKKIPEKLKKIPSIVSAFFQGIFGSKTKRLDGTATDELTGRTKNVTIKSTIATLFDNIVTTVKEFITDLPNKISSAIDFVGSIISTVVWAIFGQPGDLEKDLKEPVERVNVSNIVDSIKSIGKTILNNLLRLFTGNEDWSFNVSWVQEKVNGAWDSIKDFIVNLPLNIKNFFIGPETNEESAQGIVGNSITEFATSVGTKISEVPSVLLAAWRNVETMISAVWNTIIDTLTGKKRGLTDADKAKLTEQEAAAYDALINAGDYERAAMLRDKATKSPIVQNLEGFLGEVATYLTDKVMHFPEDIAAGFSTGASLLQTGLEKVTDWFSNSNVKDANRKKKEEAFAKKWLPFDQATYDRLLTENEADAEDYFNRSDHSAAALLEKSNIFGKSEEKDNEFLKSISEFGSTLSTLITTTIPGFISEGFTWVKNNASTWIGSLVGLFSGGEDTVDGEVNETFLDRIVNGIKSIPDKVTEALEWVKNVFRPSEYTDEMYRELTALEPTGSAATHYKNYAYRNPITDFFSNVVSSVGDVVKTIGPTVLDGIKSALEWVGNALGSATKFFDDLVANNQSIGDAIAEKEKKNGDGESSPLWDAVKNVGLTLKHIILEVIPGFISSAATYIGTQLPKLLSGIFGGGNSSENPAKEAEKNAENQVKQATNEFIKFNEEEYNRILNDKGAEAAEEYKNNSTFIPYAEAIAEDYGISQDIIEKALSNEIDGLGIFGGLLGSNAQADSLTDEEILKMQQESMANYGKSLEATELVVGKAVSRAEAIEMYTKHLNLLDEEAERRIKESNSTEGANLKDLTDEETRINKILEELNASTDETIDLSKYDNKAEVKGKSIFDNIGDIFGTITDFVKDIGNSPVKWVAIGAIILVIVKCIRDIVDQVSIVDDIGYSAKWVGIGLLMSTISGLLGYMTILAGSGTEEDLAKLEKVKENLTFMKDMLMQILEPVKWIVIAWGAKGSLEALSDIIRGKDDGDDGVTLAFENYFTGKEGFLSKTLGGLLEKISGLILSPLESLGGTAGKVLGAGMIGDLVESLAGNASNVLQELGTGLEGMSGYLADVVTNLSSVKDDIGSALDVVRQVTDLIGQMLTILFIRTESVLPEGTETEEHALEASNGVLKNINALAKVFSKLSGGLSLFKNSVTGYGEEALQVTEALGKLLGMKSDMETFAEFATKEEFTTFKNALATLGAIFRLYADASSEDFNRDPKELNISNAVKLLEQLFSNDEFIGLVESFNTSSLPNVNEEGLETAERIIIFAGALSAIGKACSDLKGDEGSSIQNLIDVVDNVKFNGNSISDFALKFGELGNALGSFASETAGLSDENLNSVERALNMLLMVADKLQYINTGNFLHDFLLGKVEDMQSFGLGIESLGGHLKAFFNAIDNIGSESGISKTHNKDNLSMALIVLQSVAEAADFMNHVDAGAFDAITKNDQLDNMATKIAGFIKTVLDPKVMPEYTDEQFEYVKKLIDIIRVVFGSIALLREFNFDKYDIITDEKKGLGAHFEAFMQSSKKLNDSILANRGSLSTIHTYYDRVLEYVAIMDKIFNALSKANMTNVDTKSMSEWMKDLDEGLFGYKSDYIKTQSALSATYEQKTHYGIVNNLINFVSDLSKIEFDESGVKVFEGITDIIGSYCDAIAEMSKAYQITTNSDQLLNYSGYVTSLASALTEIITNKQTFADFFNMATEFNKEGLANSVTLFTGLNQLVQILSGDLFSNLSIDQIMSKFSTFEWDKVFGILNDNLKLSGLTTISMQPGIFDIDAFKLDTEEIWKVLGTQIGADGAPEPIKIHITPVLDVNDQQFQTDAEQFKTLLGLDSVNINGENKNIFDVSPEMFSSLKPIDYSEDIMHIRANINSMHQTMSAFSNKLDSLAFYVDGKLAGHALAPYIDNWQGSRLVINGRTNMTQ